MAHGRGSPVKAATEGATNLQTKISQSGSKWQQKIAACQLDPTELAAAQASKASANYAAVVNNTGPGGWAAKLRAAGVSGWKAGCGSDAASQYQGSARKAARKWGNWYTQTGASMCQAMRDSAAAGRESGVDGIQRCVAALNVAKNYSNRGGNYAS